jgi:carbamate kinase
LAISSAVVTRSSSRTATGPQVGLLALQAAASSESAFPLDVLDAESAGMIGYVLQQELGNVMKDRLFATLLTQIKVDPRDPAFSSPSKPIGPVYDEATERRFAVERGWTIAPTSSDGRGACRIAVQYLSS